MYYTNDLMNWADWFNDIYMLIVMDNFWFLTAQYTSYLWHLMLVVHCSCTCQEWCFASSSYRKNFRNWFSQAFLRKAWWSVKIGNGQKPRYSSYMVTKLKNFKILPSFLHGYHIPQFQNIAIPAWFSHPTISKFYQPFTMEFFQTAT